MAEVTLRLEVDPSTRRRTIVVSYRSDADALPAEHEEEHRALVDRLVEGGLVPAEERGLVRVEREGAAAGAPVQAAADEAARKAVERKQ